MATDDPALETLFLPFAQGLLHWPQAGGVLFLRARDGAPLHAQPRPGLVCEQSFKPDADALKHAGCELLEAVAGPDRSAEPDAAGYPLVLVLPPRQREESRALMARALALTAPGGRVVACVANNEGANSAEADLRRIAGTVGSLTKHKCRVFWSAPRPDPASENSAGSVTENPDFAESDTPTHPVSDPAAAALAKQWRELDAVRPIDDGRFVSRPGVFAWNRIDPASRLLAEHLPADLVGHAADLGAGFGYLSVELLSRCPGIHALDLYEAEARALDLARENLAAFGTRARLGYHWHDVTAGLPEKYDVIVSNPPFHTQSRADRPDIGRRFIAVAAEALKPGGQLWLVANRHLPYESILTESFGSVRTVAQQDGFKIIEAVKSLPARPERTPKAFDRVAVRNQHR